MDDATQDRAVVPQGNVGSRAISDPDLQKVMVRDGREASVDTSIRMSRAAFRRDDPRAIQRGTRPQRALMDGADDRLEWKTDGSAPRANLLLQRPSLEDDRLVLHAHTFETQVVDSQKQLLCNPL